MIPNEEIVIQPGQTNSFSISLVNQGSLQASNVIGEIITSSNLLTINNSSDSWGNINAGSEESSGNGFNVTASSDVVSGSQLIASLFLSGALHHRLCEQGQINLLAELIGNLRTCNPVDV